MEQFQYGVTAGGQPVQGFTLKNRAGMEVRCIGYGCRVTHIILPDGVDVMQGFDSLAGYEADDSGQGAIIGRSAGRIAKAKFIIDGVSYHLTKNLGEDFLHGVFSHRVFSGAPQGENAVTFSYTSPDGEDGFPGNLTVSLTYTLSEDNELELSYAASTDKATYLNLTNHSYFNLAGHNAGSLEGQLLTIPSRLYLEMGKGLLPTGRMLEAAGGAFDFTKEKPILQDMFADDPQLKEGLGFDASYVVERAAPGLALAAVARDAASGRSLHVYTTEPDAHLYCANNLDGSMTGKGGVPLACYSSFCIETQHFPGSPEHPEFPTTLLRPGETYRQTTIWRFQA